MNGANSQNWPARAMWGLCTRVVRCLTAGADWLVPKRRDLVVLGSQEGWAWAGNTRALYRHLRGEPGGLEARVYLRPHTPGPADGRCLRGVTPGSLWTLLRAGTLVATHPGDFGPFGHSRRTLFIQTWHGVPLKGLVHLRKGCPKRRLRRARRLAEKISLLIAPSRLAAWWLCAAWRMDPRKVYLCGQARNDILLDGEPAGPPLAELLDQAPPFERVILSCPTWRPDAPMRFLPFDDLDRERLERWLEANRAILLARGHFLGRPDDLPPTPRVLELGVDRCPDVNEILPQVDVLVTDYSSIYVDYLLLNRPMVFVPHDLERYQREWGLMVDDYDFWAPGAKARTFEQFLAALDAALARPEEYADRRRTVNRLINAHQTSDSCRQLADLIRRRQGLSPR